MSIDFLHYQYFLDVFDNKLREYYTHSKTSGPIANDRIVMSLV